MREALTSAGIWLAVLAGMFCVSLLLAWKAVAMIDYARSKAMRRRIYTYLIQGSAWTGAGCLLLALLPIREKPLALTLGLFLLCFSLSCWLFRRARAPKPPPRDPYTSLPLP
jgi:hypothetical protein